MTIDWWTLGFQTINVAILIWLLGRFFWKPVAAMIEARRAAAHKLTDEAEATRTKAAEALADVEKIRVGFAEERDTILTAAHKAAEAAHRARLTEAETEVTALQAAAKVAIEKASTAQAASWAMRSRDLAVAIAQRLVARLDGAAVEACFLNWLVAEIRTLPAPARNALGADGVTLEATTAIVLDEAEQKHILASIGEALGGSPHINFKTDPALIAGIELRGDHLIVNSSWRADLTAIQTSLKPEQAA